jgi:parvulin-like peptidyl-prolyl isomerase
MKRYLAAFAFFCLACSGRRLDDDTVALVNDQAIKKSDLVYNVEFFPQVASNKNGLEQLHAHLDLLIEKKLFAQYAQQQGFDRNEHVKKVTSWVERDEMIKALYQQEIRDQVAVTEDELKAAFQKENQQVRLRHLLAGSEAQARQLRQQLLNGATFAELAKETFRDSTLRENGGDLGYVSYFDLDPALADSAFSLPVHQLSQPVASRWGYHLLQVEDRRQRIFAGQSEYEQIRAKLERQLRRRKEQERAGRFVTRFTDPLQIQMLNDSFNSLAMQVREMVIEADRKLPAYQPALNTPELAMLNERLSSQGQKPLILFKNGQWTIDDFFAIVEKVPLPRRPRIDTPNHLRHDIGVLIRDELLFKEAQRRRLDRDPAVMAEVAKWREDYMFGEWWQSVRDTITLGENQLQHYFQNHRGRFIMPERVHVREILTATEAEAANLLRRLQQGEDFAQLANRFSLRQQSAGRGGDLGLLERNQYGNVSLKAFDIKDGEFAGPLLVQGGYSVIQRLGYESGRPMSLDEARRQVHDQAAEAHEQLVYRSALAELRREARIVINEPLLQKLSKELYTGKERVQMVGVGGRR